MTYAIHGDNGSVRLAAVLLPALGVASTAQAALHRQTVAYQQGGTQSSEGGWPERD